MMAVAAVLAYLVVGVVLVRVIVGVVGSDDPGEVDSRVLVSAGAVVLIWPVVALLLLGAGLLSALGWLVLGSSEEEQR